MNNTRDRSVGRALGGGVVAGAVGGLVLTIINVLMTTTKGGDVWMALKGAAIPFVHERAMQPGLDPPIVLLGLIDHFVIAMIWGALFGVLANGLSRAGTVLAGAFWGIAVWLGMYYVVLPLAGMGEMARSQPVAGAVIMHVVFGLAVGVAFLPFQRTHTVEPPAVRAPVM